MLAQPRLSDWRVKEDNLCEVWRIIYPVSNALHCRVSRRLVFRIKRPIKNFMGIDRTKSWHSNKEIYISKRFLSMYSAKKLRFVLALLGQSYSMRAEDMANVAMLLCTLDTTHIVLYISLTIRWARRVYYYYNTTRVLLSLDTKESHIGTRCTSVYVDRS
jgi:hypothetical protein